MFKLFRKRSQKPGAVQQWENPFEIPMHNTRIFPKNEGASACRLTGIAARCDWVLMTDGGLDESDEHFLGDPARPPRTVFVSMRSFYNAIPYFFEEILPKIDHPFVLITGSEDLTIPNQIDARWRPFNDREKRLIKTIAEDERVIHWFAENRDELWPEMSTLPVGYVFMDDVPNKVKIYPPETPVKDRPLKMFCAHRVREGEQWEIRRQVTELCSTELAATATVLTGDVSEAEFERMVRDHPFVLCVQGGGIDPSPKAWQTIANGSIPIIKSSALDDAYRQLPVAIVDEWSAAHLSEERLQKWIVELGPHYESPKLRKAALHRLSIDYWWNQIVAAYSRST